MAHHAYAVTVTLPAAGLYVPDLAVDSADERQPWTSREGFLAQLE